MNKNQWGCDLLLFSFYYQLTDRKMRIKKIHFYLISIPYVFWIFILNAWWCIRRNIGLDLLSYNIFSKSNNSLFHSIYVNDFPFFLLLKYRTAKKNIRNPNFGCHFSFWCNLIFDSILQCDFFQETHYYEFKTCINIHPLYCCCCCCFFSANDSLMAMAYFEFKFDGQNDIA